MKILPVSDPSFQNYGQVLEGYDLKELLSTLDKVTPCPEGVEYVPEQPELQALAIEKELRNNAYGGMPIQLGWCNGHNTKMNCMEYHRDSELNVGTELHPAAGQAGESGRRRTGRGQGCRVLLPRRHAGGSIRHHAALRSLQRKEGPGIQGSGGSAQGNQPGEAGNFREERGGRDPVGCQQMAAGPCGFLRSGPGSQGAHPGNKPRHRGSDLTAEIQRKRNKDPGKGHGFPGSLHIRGGHGISIPPALRHPRAPSR